MRRGWDMVEGAVIPADEPETVNHLVFVVHGIGSWCDLKFRKVTECGEPRRGVTGGVLVSPLGSACCFVIVITTVGSDRQVERLVLCSFDLSFDVADGEH